MSGVKAKKQKQLRYCGNTVPQYTIEKQIIYAHIYTNTYIFINIHEGYSSGNELTEQPQSCLEEPWHQTSSRE